MLLYLETTVPNFLFCTDAPERRETTEKLFEQILEGRFEACLSELYFEEIRRVSSPLLHYQLHGVPEVYELDIVEMTPECHTLARAYVDFGAFTAKNYADALHVAVAVHHGCDIVVSWNFKHIVRYWTVARVNEVNQERKLGHIAIHSPEEVIEREGT